MGRRPAWALHLALVVVLATIASSCQHARAGTPCGPPNSWGHDDTYLLLCRGGRWDRVMTLDEYARRVEENNRVRALSVPAFRVVYVVPAGAPAQSGITAAIRQELGVVNGWFASQTDGRRIRFASNAGGVAVTVVRIPYTAAQVDAAPSPYALIAGQLVALGLRPDADSNLAYVEARRTQSGPGSADVCGEGAARLAIVWTPSCARPSAGVRTFPIGSTFISAHELLHAMGAVPSCAPHFDGHGHVFDNPRDILYHAPPGGPPRNFGALALDPGRDDYYGHPRNCPDVADSPYWG